MSEPFLGEIRLMSFAFPPKGWAPCDGQLMPINQNQALFSLLGTMYGGNGITTFALPDLRARTPLHVGQGHTIGEAGGSAQHTLTIAETPLHTHQMHASTAPAQTASPQNATLAAAALYKPLQAPVSLGATTTAGGTQAHNNMQPSSTISFCIALQGIFPSSN